MDREIELMQAKLQARDPTRPNDMNPKEKVQPGYRYFKCEHCWVCWRETCRDHSTLSNSRCINADCKSNTEGGVMPYGSYPTKAVEVDAYGNLVDEVVKEKTNL